MNSVGTSDNCAMCSKEVRKAQQAMSCDVCEAWVHRKCDGRMTQTAYWALNRRIARGELTGIEWTCLKCA